MRSRTPHRPVGTIAAISLALMAGGCSTGSSTESFQTSSNLAPPRPQAGVNQPRPQQPSAYSAPQASYSQPSYSQSYSAQPTYTQQAYAQPAPQPAYAQQSSYGYAPQSQPPYSPPPSAYNSQQAYGNPRPAYIAPPGYANGPYGNNGYQPSYNPTYGQAPPPGPQAYAAPATAPQFATGSINRATPRYYDVREGDTLNAIARKTGLDAAKIALNNHIADGKIKIGQRLTLPTR